MPFSAALSIGANLLGSRSASRDARRDRRLQREQMAMQREFQEQQMAMARDAQAAQAEDNAYRRQIEQQNRLLAQQERQWQMQQLEQQRQMLLQERQADIDRQIQEDRAAARQRQFQLEQLLQNQELAEQEREFAVAQLREAQAVASGERDEDRRRFLEERAMAEANRDFVMQEYQQAQQQAMAERQRDVAIQDQILTQASALQEQLEGRASELGYVPEIPRLRQSDIDAEINRRSQQYLSDVDRAADRVASVNEAELIRGGIDRSTPATARRGEIAARLSQEYQNARQRAYDDALSYITGRQDTLASNVGNIMDRRQALLGETADIHGQELQALQNLRNARSAMGAFDMAAAVPTGIHTRDLRSANDYRPPVDIDSAIYDRANIGMGLANRIPLTSAANANWQSVGSAANVNPASQTIGSPASIMNNAATTGNNILSNLTNQANQSRQRSINASAALASDITGLLADQSDNISNAFSNLFNVSGSPSFDGVAASTPRRF